MAPAQECRLSGRQALLLASDEPQRRAIVEALGELGIECAAPRATAPARAAIPARPDLLVLGNRTEAYFAEGLIRAVLYERPWIPVVVARGHGRASALGPDVPFDLWYERSHRLPAEDLRVAVARSICRALRHPLLRATCPLLACGMD